MAVNTHDLIIEKMRSLLITQGYKVRVNFKFFGQNKQRGKIIINQKLYILLRTYYPDVYTYDDIKHEVTNIYEVETSETITPESAKQWKLYANGSAKLYLVVPKIDLEKTKQLVASNNIKVAEYYTY